MNTKALVAATLVVVALTVRAEEQPTRADLRSPESLGLQKNFLDWDDPKWWETMRKKDNGVAIGRGDLVAEGPIVKTFRRRRDWSDLGFGEKIISLPIINLFVPQPMNIAPRSRGGPKLGDYFKWSELDQPWSNLGDHPIGGPGLINVSY